MTEEDSLKQDEAEALSEIFSEDKKGEEKEAVSEELLQPNILELISSTVFKEYNLDERDVKIGKLRGSGLHPSQTLLQRKFKNSSQALLFFPARRVKGYP